MRRWACWALAVAGCATTPTGPLGTKVVLPPARVTTRSELVLRCTPDDAEVALDGVPQGTCADFDGEPRTLGLGAGARHVRVKKRGYLPWESLMQADNTRVVMTVSLIPSEGQSP